MQGDMYAGNTLSAPIEHKLVKCVSVIGHVVFVISSTRHILQES